MAKRTLSREWIPEPNIWDQGSFVPASSQDPPPEIMVLQEAYLGFPSTSSIGIPGIFSYPPDQKNLKQPPPTLHQKASYDLTIEDIPLSANKIVRYIISPASDTTIIPMSLQRNNCSKNHFTNSPTNVQETVYFFQLKKGGSSLVSGLRTNVKLDLVVWDFEKFTREGGIYGGAARRFQIDGAVLLDPKRSQFHPSESPVCLLGMDFLMKYPYLLFEPRYDTRGEIDFILARGPFAYRPYSTYTEVKKKLIIHISACYDTDTGRIGCGVFFKSGSILNLLSGVSKYDKDGNKHTEQLWERGILMGVIKALHIVTTFSTNREFTDVLIRTGSPPTNSLLSQLQHTTDDLYQRFGNDHDDYSIGDSFSCPSPNSDLVMYIYHQFIRKKTGIKVHFHGFSTNENYDAVEAAGILASAGAEMEEFHIENEVKNASTHDFSGYSINQSRNHKHTKSHNIASLHHHGGFVGHSIYAGLGLDGYFHIPKERAHTAMEAADKKACLNLCREDAILTLGYAPWEGEVAAMPNGLLDIKNYEYHAIPQGGNFTTLDGILGKDTAKKLKTYLKENSKLTPEQVLKIIQSSNREIKAHEFLSMQTKQYREGYLKELELKGLEKGWHFCKDKAWNGYLRRNIRVYSRGGWMRSYGGEMRGEIFTLSSEKMDLDQWDEERATGHTGDARGKKQQGIFHAEPAIGPTGVRKDTERDPQTNKECAEPHGKVQLRKDTKVISSNIINDPGPKNSPSHHLLNINYSDGTESVDTIGIKYWTEELTDSEDLSYINYTSSGVEHVGIKARVAARRRYGPNGMKGRYSGLGNGILDGNYGTDDSSDSDYGYHVGNSDGHSSEQWSDPGSSTESHDLIRACIAHTEKGKADYPRNPNRMNSLQQWKPQFSDTIPTRADIINEKSLDLKGSANPLGAALIIGKKGVKEHKEHKESKGKSEKALVTSSSGKHNTSAKRTEKPDSGIEGVENKWPPSDWMLENFQEDYPTTFT